MTLLIMLGDCAWGASAKRAGEEISSTQPIKREKERELNITHL